MPAEITSKDQMFYLKAEGTPWHGLGTEVEDAPDSAAAIELAGLGWHVRTAPMMAPNPNPAFAPIESAERVVIQREDDGAILGAAKQGYEPVQNGECFDWMDSLLEDDILRYATAGSLRGGEKVWLLALFHEGFEIAGETWKRYLALQNDHTGSGSLSATLTSVRIVCANTLDAAFSGGASIRLRHTRSIHDRMQQARRVMEITTRQQRRMQELLTEAAVRPVDRPLVDGIVEEIFGKPQDRSGRAQANVERFRGIVGAEFVRNGQTAYSLINGITGYADHVRSGDGTLDQRRNERRFEAVTMGGGAAFKAQYVKQVLQAVGIDGR